MVCVFVEERREGDGGTIRSQSSVAEVSPSQANSASPPMLLLVKDGARGNEQFMLHRLASLSLDTINAA